MAALLNPAALVAAPLPMPWQSGQLLAFKGPNYSQQGEPIQASTDAVMVDGYDRQPIISDGLVPVAVPPPIGGFDLLRLTQAAGGLIQAVTRTAGQIWSGLLQLWGALNGRNYTPGQPAQYETGAFRGNWNPTGTNLFKYRLKGRRYERSYPDVYDGVNAGVPVDEITARPYVLQNGNVPQIIYWPPHAKAPYHNFDVWFGDAFVAIPNNEGVYILDNFLRLAGIPIEGVLTATVEPVDGPGVPYPATTPATPTTPDPFALIPKVPAPAALPVADPKKPVPTRPRVLPLAPVAPSPAKPAAVPKAQPITQPAPDSNGPSRQITITTGLLGAGLAVKVPQIAPLRAQPIPGLEPFFKPSGDPQPSPVPEPDTTPTDARKYGPLVVTSGAPATSPEAIANELGRVEQKLGLLLPMTQKQPSWLDGKLQEMIDKLIDDLTTAIQDALQGGGGQQAAHATYQFTPPYDTVGVGLAEARTFDIAAQPYGPAMVERLDAIAEALQVLSAWRVKLAKGNALRPNVTLTAYGTPDP